jgi:hypothetical protein
MTSPEMDNDSTQFVMCFLERINKATVIRNNLYLVCSQHDLQSTCIWAQETFVNIFFWKVSSKGLFWIDLRYQH